LKKIHEKQFGIASTCQNRSGIAWLHIINKMYRIN
jgi:hypothetical protein